MPRQFLAALVFVFVSAGSLTAGEDFDANSKALNVVLQARTLESSALPPFENLLKLASTDEQCARATSMLATALEKAGQYERAAEQWGAFAELQRKIHKPDSGGQVYIGEINRLRDLERQKPIPGVKIRAAAEKALAATDPAPTTAQKLNLGLYAAKGIQAEQNPAAAVAYLAGLAAKAGNEDGYRIEILLQLAQFQLETKAVADAMATYTRILADQQATPDQRGRALYAQGFFLSRNGKPQEALAAAQRMLPEISQATQASGKLSPDAMNSLRWASGLACKIGDYAQAEAFINGLTALTKDPEWLLGARQDLAGLRRAQGRFADAEGLYTELMGSQNVRLASEAQLIRAFLVYRDLKDVARGLPLVEAALGSEQIQYQQRAKAVMDEAHRLLALGDRDGAAGWYARIEKLPGGGAEQPRQVSKALVEMGQIAESRNDTATAKKLYQRALDMADGDNDARVRARNALESIRYFE